jgi:hypothetical protein
MPAALTIGNFSCATHLSVTANLGDFKGTESLVEVIGIQARPNNF